MSKSLKPVTILVTVTLVCLVPFTGKAFHIDDPLFLWSAKQIQAHPKDFYGFTVNWTGFERPMAYVTQNPPLASYFIALATILFGWSEIALHLVFLLPALGVVLGTWYLARQLCTRPLLAALTALATPVFLISSSNVMCDTMMLAFWVWAVGFWLRGKKAGEGQRFFLASSFLAALAVITKFFAVSLIPLLFAFSLIQKRGLSKEQWFLLVPVIAVLGYEWITHLMYGHGHFSQAIGYSISIRNELNEPSFFKGLIGLSFTGGCLATVIIFAPIMQTRKLLPGILLLVIFFMILIPFLLPNKPSFKTMNWPLVLQFAIFIVGGLGLLVLAVADFLKHKDSSSILLLLWVFGTFIFATFVNWMVNGRSILPMIPAMGILLARRIEESHQPLNLKEKSFWGLAWPIVPSIILAVLTTCADYQMAGNARTSAVEITQKYGKEREKLLFAGHWGFQYYMESGGGRPLRPNLSNEDILVIPKYNIVPKELFVPENNVQWKRTIRRPLFPWLATMNNSTGAGFYSHSWGFLPFVFGKVPVDQYTVIRIKAL